MTENTARKPQITITEAERIVRDQLGAGWTCVKLGRYWLVGTLDKNAAGSGWKLVAQAGTLDKAIREAKAASR